MEAVDLLRYPVFFGLDETRIRKFVSEYPVSVRTYAADSLIFAQNSHCNWLLLLEEGMVRVQIDNAEGKRLTIEDLKAPRVLAPAAVFSSENLLPVNIVSLTNCKMLFINRDGFFNLLHSETQVMQNFLQILSDKSIFLSKKISSFTLQNLKSRLASYLLNAKTLNNKQEIAAELGVARQSLARVLSELIAEGIIEMDGRKILVVNEKQLKYYATK